MHTEGLVAAFREDMRDMQAPYLWSDSELIRYIVEAQRQICIKAWGITDIMTVTIPAELTDPVSISKRILRINKAFDDNGRELTMQSLEETDDVYRRSPGNICALVLDVKEHAVVPYPPPVAETDIKLHVYRLPLEDPSAVDTTELELSDEASEGIVLYMRYLAALKNDTETLDVKLAEQFLALFERFAEQYRKQRERRVHNPRKTIGYW